MSTKIVNQITDQDKLLSGSEVTASQLNDLSENFFLRLKIREGDKFRDLDCSDHNNKVMNDTKTIYFSKTNLDSLFADNEGSDGLMIYPGIHKNSLYPIGDPNYENKVMVVLVSTTDGIPNLKINDFVKIAGAPGSGMDNGKLCPPNTNC